MLEMQVGEGWAFSSLFFLPQKPIKVSHINAIVNLAASRLT